MFQAIAGMEYLAQTSYADSKNYMSCEAGDPSQGIFQGNVDAGKSGKAEDKQGRRRQR